MKLKTFVNSFLVFLFGFFLLNVQAEAKGIKSVAVAKVATKAKSIWTPDNKKGLNSVDNAYAHWNKHKTDFPKIENSVQYVKSAKQFINNPPKNALIKLRGNGDKVVYEKVTNTFGVANAQGIPRTFFKPTDKMKYFIKQIKK